MKIIFLVFMSGFSAAALAQPKMITKAVISTTTNVIAPEDEDVSQIQNQGGGGFNFRNFGDGETKSTTYIKDDLTKTSYKSEMGRGSVYRNNTTKVTTTIIEAMGNKFGFFTSDQDAVEMMKRNDSIRAARNASDTASQRRVPRSGKFPVSIVTTEETKKIAGYDCKKAWVITDKLIAKDSQAVWYTPQIKFANVSSSGGLSGPGNFGNNSGFEKIDGFVMQYDMIMPRGRTMEVKVTKIETDKDVSDKEFEIPKDVEVKSMKDMQGQPGGGFRFTRP